MSPSLTKISIDDVIGYSITSSSSSLLFVLIVWTLITPFFSSISITFPSFKAISASPFGGLLSKISST